MIRYSDTLSSILLTVTLFTTPNRVTAANKDCIHKYSSLCTACKLDPFKLEDLLAMRGSVDTWDLGGKGVCDCDAGASPVSNYSTGPLNKMTTKPH